ncbi:Transposase [Rhizobiales bacterium GAS191]|nr:Transposase [Rhizobiales bacterium GAS191]
MKRLGMPASDDTILRQLKRQVAARSAKTAIRVAGIDDWSWRKGCGYGTIVVNLERREVVDVLPNRSAAGTANWLSKHPEVEIVSRDRCGLYAQGAREGASQARQVADRFHLLQNLRETIETQLTRADRSTGRALLPTSDGEDESGAAIACSPRGQREVAEHRHLARQAQRLSRQTIFDRIRALHDARVTACDIARKTGFGRRSITKWLRLIAPCGATRRRAKAMLAGRLPGLSVASLGGRLRPWPRSVPRDQTPRLHRQFLPPGAAPGEVARRQRQCAASGAQIAKDRRAVLAAITEPWSNGQTEGQITKLKLVKRQMYGRAKLDLLQARLIGAA